MSITEHYMNLPFDLSGSRAKNRFRNELLWGLKKMLELYKESDDFTMVFDYSCDIEVHKKMI
nr:dsDNA nuclease domain-containing protein [Planococcus citreus]